MKKRLFAMLLSALLVANISACVYVPENGIEDRTSETETSTESLDTNDTQSPPLESESDDVTLRDVPGLGQLRRCYHLDNSPMASVWRSDENNEYYVYINEWDAYRPMRGLSSSYYNWWDLNDHCVTIENDATTIALIDQGSSYGEPTILTYHFSRSNELVELHAVPLNIKVTRDDLFFVNMHDTNHGYYFLLPRSFPHYGSDWPLIMFETTDGGKSWNQIATYTFYATARYVEIFKFISPQIGIISFRDLGTCEVWERTYLTVDGGLTWTQMSKLPPSDMVNWYSEIIDFEYVKEYDYYRLTVKASNYTSFQIQLWSKDLINWTLIET